MPDCGEARSTTPKGKALDADDDGIRIVLPTVGFMQLSITEFLNTFKWIIVSKEHVFFTASHLVAEMKRLEHAKEADSTSTEEINSQKGYQSCM